MPMQFVSVFDLGQMVKPLKARMILLPLSKPCLKTVSNEFCFFFVSIDLYLSCKKVFNSLVSSLFCFQLFEQQASMYCSRK